ncbi:hypothetical protein HDU67_009640, partial [Dinochytrium kinnereticum]
TTFLSLDKPDYQNYIRGAYLLTQAIALATLYVIYLRIVAKNDTTEITYIDSKNPFDSNADPITITHMEHDISKVKESLQQILIAVAVMSYLHFQMGYLRPVILQVAFGLRTLSVSPAFRVHILGRETKGDLERPWKNKMFARPAPPPPTPKELKAIEKKLLKKKLNRND